MRTRTWVRHDAGLSNSANTGNHTPTTMRSATIICMFTLLGTSGLLAQSQSTLDKAGSHNTSCLLMSDSMSTALGVSADQIILITASDEKLLKACEKLGYRTSGTLDQAAMRIHESEMKEILTAEQYMVWSDFCIPPKAEQGVPAPVKY